MKIKCHLFVINFHPETVYFVNLGVKLRGSLCGVLIYASAELLVAELETVISNIRKVLEFPDKN